MKAKDCTAQRAEAAEKHYIGFLETNDRRTSACPANAGLACPPVQSHAEKTLENSYSQVELQKTATKPLGGVL